MSKRNEVGWTISVPEFQRLNTFNPHNWKNQGSRNSLSRIPPLGSTSSGLVSRHRRNLGDGDFRRRSGGNWNLPAVGLGRLDLLHSIVERFGFSFVRPLLLGGVAYTLGALVLSLHGPPLISGVIGAHELWHVAVLLGLAMHWRFVFSFAGGPPEALAN